MPSDDDRATPGAATPFIDVPVEITIAVGRAKPTIRELLALTHASVLPLDRKVDDPVELFVGGRLIARGELQEAGGESEGELAVRLTEVIDPREAG